MCSVSLVPKECPARVLLLGQNRHFMKAAAELLGRYCHLTVVAQLNLGDQSLARAKVLRPEVVLVDLDTANGDGLQAIPRLRRSLPGVGIIAMTLADGHAYVQAAQEAGADELVAKSRLVTDLLPAIGRLSKQNRRSFPRTG